MSAALSPPSLAGPVGGTDHAAPRHHPPHPRRSFATRLFGYDVFISFALGQPPRGTQSYASDLARKLQEHDFSVFFSENEPPGKDLDDTLNKALRRSSLLVVIASRGTLERPGWVRKEVETFRALHPTRPIIPISIAGALSDDTLLDAIRPWLDVRETIWLDDTREAVEQGLTSHEVVERLILAPRSRRATEWWRLTVAGVSLALIALSASSIWSGHLARVRADEARDEARKARLAEERTRAELRTSTGLRLRVEASAMFAGLRPAPDERAMLQLLAALRLSGTAGTPDPDAEGELLAGLRHQRHLVRLVDTPQALLAVAVAPRGERLVTVADDGRLQLWNARTAGRLGEALSAHDEDVRSIAYSPDGRRVITASNDTTLRLWDVSGEAVTAALAFPFTGHQDAVRAVAFSPDGRLVASGSDDTTARLWDLRTSLPAGPPLAGHDDSVTAVAFSPDGRLLVTASNDTRLRLWDVRSGKLVGAPFIGHTDSVRCVAFSPDGRRLVSGAWDSTLILWDVASRQAVTAPLVGHDGLIRSVDFSPDGRLIVSAGQDGSVRLWNAQTGAPVGTPLIERGAAVSAARFIPGNADRVVTVGFDRSLRLLDPRTTSPIGAPLADGHRRLVSLAVSPDGKRLAAGGDDLRLHLWRVAARREADDKDGNEGKEDDTRTDESPLPPLPSPTTAVEFSPDGSRLAAGGFDGSLRLIDGRSGEASAAPVAAHPRPVSALAWSPDGRRIATGSWDASVRIWNATDGSPVGPPLLGHEAWIGALAWSPDGRSLAAASADRTLRRWDVATGQPIGRPMVGHQNWVLALAFSPDGTRLYSGSADNTLRRWDAATGDPLGDALEGHRRWVTGVAVSPDGRHLVSGSWDRTLRLWRADSGLPVGGAVDGHADNVARVAFRPGGRTIHSAGRDGGLHLWAAPRRWPEMLCSKLTHNMSTTEWHDWVSPDIAYVEQCPGLPAATD